MANKREFKASRGINKLLSNINQELEENREEVVKQLASNFAMLPIAQIAPNPNQPRKDFEPEALAELAESIKTLGVVQPITVKRLDNNQYEIISGERRYRASKMAGLDEMPAYIRVVNDQELLEMALIENIQRRDLNAIEIANSYSRLIVEFNLTHQQLSERVGKKRSVVTNYLRLLKLDPAIQSDVKKGLLTMGHARALAGIQDLAVMGMIHQRIIAENLSVRQTEDLVKQYNEPKPDKTAASNAPKLDPAYQQVQRTLTDRFATKVNLKVSPAGKGQIVINFNDTHDLNRILDLLDEE